MNTIGENDKQKSDSDPKTIGDAPLTNIEAFTKLSLYLGSI